ncbi:hypothetical protein ACIGC1_26070 [Peribacillus butanolivorans]|uniref:hypothetical protein n=1 Tax=Peribacillus butanolivorans TaxID=421767 RepID=UPI0037CB729A
MAYAKRHSYPPYRWALALHTLEEGVFWREMIKIFKKAPLLHSLSLPLNPLRLHIFSDYLFFSNPNQKGWRSSLDIAGILFRTTS